MVRSIDGVLSEVALRALAGDGVFARGEDYVRLVQGLRFRDGQAQASVQGKRVYVVALSWASGDISDECTCLHRADGNFCKHLVAVGLAVINATVEHVGDTSGVRGYLEALDAEALRALVLELASYSEKATRDLELRAALAQGQTNELGDLLTAAVTHALSPRGFIDYRRTFAVARDIQEVLDEASTYLDRGAADAVRPALLKALTRLRTLTLRADDSSGVLGDACRRAADLYARSCRQGHPDPRKLASWLLKFRSDSPGWPETVLEDFVSAFDEKALAAYRRGVAALDQKLQGADQYRRFGVRQMLLELADHDGDVDRAVELLSAGDSPEFVGIVARLRSAGRAGEAMAWVDRAVAAGRVSARMGSSRGYWLDPEQVARWYVDDGRTDEAITLLREQFEREPSLASYQLLGRLGDELGCGARERDWAKDAERARVGGGRGGALLVEIALREKDLDAAWGATEAYGAGHAWRELAKASAATRPRQAADLYRPWLEASLRDADTSKYPEIAKTLREMGALYAAAGSVEEFEDEIRLLRVEYRRRPSFIAALDKAGLPR